MIRLIDTSAWIEALREGGQSEIRSRVERLLLGGWAAWCDLIRLELRMGARGRQERHGLDMLESSIENLPMDKLVWDEAYRLAEGCRRKGITVPATDLAVAACAQRHGVGLEHNDRHFDLIGRIL